jgi:hypothetical protein
MAVLSTLLYRTMWRLQASETSTHPQVLDTSNGSTSFTPYTCSAIPTSPLVSQHTGSSHGAAYHTHLATSGVAGYHCTGNAYESAPMDGPQDDMWFCPDCGDGPYGSWQVSCASCYRNKPAGYHAQHDTLMDPYASIKQAPMDGPEDKVWFCSSCGDGPIGDWQNVCQSCQHQRCGGCHEEER